MNSKKIKLGDVVILKSDKLEYEWSVVALGDDGVKVYVARVTCNGENVVREYFPEAALHLIRSDDLNNF